MFISSEASRDKFILAKLAKRYFRKGEAVDELRWKIIGNDDVDEIERSRLIERLFARCNEQKIREMARSICEKTSSELIKVTAHNLSTAGDEDEP